MPEPISFGELSFEVVSSMDETQAAPAPETQFRIALLGDFSGGTRRRPASKEKLRSIRVDRDNLDEVILKLGVEVHLSLVRENEALVISFAELDDFHPDRIFERLEVFQSLRDLRSGLSEDATFADAAARVRSWLHTETPEPRGADEREAGTRSPGPSGTKISGSLLDQVVAETTGEPVEPEPAKTSQPGSDLDAFVGEIVKPYLVADKEPERQQLLAIVDSAVSQVMEAILHHPEFQALEAAWRSVAFLVSRLESDSALRIYLVDLTKEELAADLGAREDLRATVLYKYFVEETVETFGGEPWSLLAGCYTFEPSPADIATLGRLAKIARQAGAPFIGGAHERFLGCEALAKNPNPGDWKLGLPPETAEAWAMLRHMQEAAFIGLVLPRFLLRLPYGADTEEAESFDFEEMGSVPEHDSYLWGSGAIAGAYLLGMAFNRSGWHMHPGEIQEIANLPLHVCKVDDESRIKPCAEVVLTQDGAEAMLAKGFMPLLSFMNQDFVRLARFQAVADPPTRLAGRWC